MVKQREKRREAKYNDKKKGKRLSGKKMRSMK